MNVRMILLFVCYGLLAWACDTRAQTLEQETNTIKPHVEGLRGLPFLKDVATQYQSVEELQQVLQREIERTYPGETLHNLEKRLLKFGFVASPVDLRAQFTRLFSQQIAGYYDPREKRMVLITPGMNNARQSPVFPIEMFSKWIVERSGLVLEDILLVHELTHVVQDQHFDLLSLPIEALDPEDTTSAVKALIEGDATIVMFDYMLAPQGLDVTQVPELSGTLHTWTESPLVRGLSMFQTVPRYLIDNLLFPYIYGFDFVLHLKRLGGWELVNQSYQDMPVSTEQILHPEKYVDGRDMPTHISLPDLPDDFAAWREIERNTLGEFNITILLDGYLSARDARQAGAGWDGDRFSLYEHADTGAYLLLWYSAWDDEVESEEFFHNMVSIIEKRYATSSDMPHSAEGITRTDDTLRFWETAEGLVMLERRRQDVVLIDGISSEHIGEFLRSHVWNSRVERRD